MQEVETKLAGIERRFNDLRARKDGLESDLETVNAELFRLQGENRVLQELQEVDPALTVSATPKEEIKHGK